MPTPETATAPEPGAAPRRSGPVDPSARSTPPEPRASSAPTSSPRRSSAPRGVVAEHWRSTLKFLVVGGLVFFVDAAMYNLLVFWDPAHGWGTGALHGQPLLAKILTIGFASCLTYLGNRLWTFGDRPRPGTMRSIVLFILVNLIASALQLGCLGFSRYVLGWDTALADNIFGTFIGQVVSTSFRYVTYGRWVFPRR